MLFRTPGLCLGASAWLTPAISETREFGNLNRLELSRSDRGREATESVRQSVRLSHGRFMPWQS